MADNKEGAGRQRAKGRAARRDRRGRPARILPDSSRPQTTITISPQDPAATPQAALHPGVADELWQAGANPRTPLVLAEAAGASPSASTAFQETVLPLDADLAAPQSGDLRSAVGRAAQANKVAIVLSVETALLLIEQKLASLREERSNEAIAHFEQLRQDIEALRGATLQLVERGQAGEENVERAENRFMDGIRKWWEKDHESICNKVLDTALFTSCVAVCALFGDPVAVAVSGALIGGKNVVDALKALPKK